MTWGSNFRMPSDWHKSIELEDNFAVQTFGSLKTNQNHSLDEGVDTDKVEWQESTTKQQSEPKWQQVC